MKIFKRFMCIILVALFMLSLSAPAFAANYSANCSARSASCELVSKKCKLGRWWAKDSITVTNNGNIKMWVYMNGCFQKELAPGRSYTYSTWGSNVNVKVYSVTRSFYKQNVQIKTSSGTIA